MFILKPHSGIAIYRQLADQVRRMVASGQLQPGDELPSIRELALKHTINPMTVSKVYSILEAEGILVRTRGKPMKVAPSKKQKKGQVALSERIQALDGQLENLVLAGKQLEIEVEDVIEALRKQWGKEQ